MCDILPGILEQDFAAIEQKLQIITPFAKAVHIDLLDGKFAPNTTLLDPKPFAKYTKEIFFEVHMMVEDPLSYVNAFAKAGFRRFVGHVEHMESQEAFVAKVQQVGEVGLALDVGSTRDAIRVPLIDLDAILVMTVKAGFSHQSFLPEQLQLVTQLSRETKTIIEIDGGVNDKTLQQAKQAGASRFVSTGFLFKVQNAQSQYRILEEACSQSLSIAR